MSTCRSCGAPIVWAITRAGKRMPLDAEPVELPAGLFLLGDESPPRAVGLQLATTLYQSHFATCPHAAQHRKAAPKRDAVTPAGETGS